MEVWLRDEKNNKSFRFPVIPMPISVNSASLLSTSSIVKKGNVSIYDGNDLDSFPLDGFFPKSYVRGYCNYSNFPSPWECVEIINNWLNNGDVLRYIITGTSINVTVRISSFSYNIENGTGNIYYSIKLTEFKNISLPNATTVDPLKKNKGIQTAKKVDNKPRNNITKSDKTNAGPSRVHIVKHGEFLYMIAQKYYGMNNGSKWVNIKNNAENQKNYPKLKSSNVIYSGWKLVIP